MEISSRSFSLPPSIELPEAAPVETVKPPQTTATAAASAPPAETAAPPPAADRSRKGDFTLTGQMSRMQLNALLDEAKVQGEKPANPRDVVDPGALGGRIRTAVTPAVKEGLAENFGLGLPGSTAPTGGGPAAIPGTATLLPGGLQGTESAGPGSATERLGITDPLSGRTLDATKLLGPLGEPPAQVGSESYAPSVRLRGQSGLPRPDGGVSLSPNTSTSPSAASSSSTPGTTTSAATGRERTESSSGGTSGDGYFANGGSVTMETEASDTVDSEGNQSVSTHEKYTDNDTGATLEVTQTETNGVTETHVVLKDKDGKVVEEESSTSSGSGSAGMTNPEEGDVQRGDLNIDVWALRSRLIGLVSQQLEPSGDAGQPFKRTITSAPVDPARDPNPEGGAVAGGVIPTRASVPGAGLIGGDPIGPDGSSGGSKPAEFRRDELPDEGPGDPRVG
jgi:hypothetical protein